MGSCGSMVKNVKYITKAKLLLQKEGFEVLEVKNAKKAEKRISNNIVVIAKRDGKIYAIKVRHYENQLDQQGITAQVGVLKDLAHPNIVRVVNHFSKQHMFFFQLGYYPETLFEFLKQHTLTREQQFHLAVELLSAIEFVHSQGHTHRELKTQNVLISHENLLSAEDLKLKISPESLSPSDKTHRLSPSDKPPEQVLNEKETVSQIIPGKSSEISGNQQHHLLICEFGLELDSDIAIKKLETCAESDKWFLAPEIKLTCETIYYQQNKQTDIWAVGLIIAEIFGWVYTSKGENSQYLEQKLKLISNKHTQEECLSCIEKDVRVKILQMLNINPDKRGEMIDYMSFFQEKDKELNGYQNSLTKKLDTIEKLQITTSSG